MDLIEENYPMTYKEFEQRVVELFLEPYGDDVMDEMKSRVDDMLNEKPQCFLELEYGAAWYTLAAMTVLIYLLKAGRVSVYDNPIMYEIMPDGSKRRIKGSGAGGGGFLSMFSDAEGNSRLALFWQRERAAGCFAIGMILFILLGSALTIVFGGE